jgi:cytoskeletal protein CcmA (bactofilin family)
MLFRKRSESPAAVPAPGVPSAAAPIAVAIGGGGTVVGAQTRVRGVIRGSGPVLVRGSVKGEILIKGGLTVSSTGLIEADVEAQSVELSGEARGAVRATSRVVMSPTGVFEGEMATPVLEVQPGSVVRGRARVAGFPMPGSERLSH